jgi:acyl carrier protein
MRENETIERMVFRVVSEQMGVTESELSRSTRLQEDLNADSLDAVELVMEFEDELEISIPDSSAEKVRTVGEMIDLLSGEGEAGIPAKLKPKPSGDSEHAA